MSDLIDRQAAIDALGDGAMVNYQAAGHNNGLVKAIDVIKGLPSAHPEIIRCKECKHFHYDMPYVIQGVPILGHEVCDFWGDGCKTAENGFCSYAERRINE